MSSVLQVSCLRGYEDQLAIGKTIAIAGSAGTEYFVIEGINFATNELTVRPYQPEVRKLHLFQDECRQRINTSQRHDYWNTNSKNRWRK